jgi:glycyl-tRNA synthetase (class II)
LAALIDSYTKENSKLGEEEARIYLKLNPKIAPIKV